MAEFPYNHLGLIPANPYHRSYHENRPLNANGPHQYSQEQLDKRATAQQESFNRYALGGAIGNTAGGLLSSTKIIEPIEETIKVESISKSEFKRLQREDIIAVWEELTELNN